MNLTNSSNIYLHIMEHYGIYYGPSFNLQIDKRFQSTKDMIITS